LLHAQIEVEGALVFGGYDRFHRQCVRAASPITTTFLQRLVENGVLRSYESDAQPGNAPDRQQPASPPVAGG